MPSSSHTDPGRDPRPWEWLYDLVGAGMWASSRLRFDVQVVGAIPPVRAGQLWVVSHRAESDVPVLSGVLYGRGGMWRHRGPASRVHFAARDDLFAPGVISAGLPMPTPLARLAWPLSPGPWLPRVRAHPVRRPTGLKLAQALGELPAATRLETIVAVRVLSELARCAAGLGRTPPATVGEARDAAFRDVLWGDVTASDLVAPAGEAIWRRHVARSAGDLRRLVGLVRAGEPLVVFPEGRLSPDGGLGPVGDVLRVLVERGRPEAVIPVALTYDLLRRRPTVTLAVAPAVDVAGGPVGDAVLDAWRSSIALTVGQVVARVVREHAARGEPVVSRRLLLERLADESKAAAAVGRPRARAVRSPGGRARGLDRAVAELVRRGGAQSSGELVSLDPQAVRADPLLARLETEHRAFQASPRRIVA